MTWLSQCIWCHETDYIHGDLCESCWSSLPHLSEVCCQCAMPLPAQNIDRLTDQADDSSENQLTGSHRRCGQCQQTPQALDYCYAGFRYDWPISMWIKQAKDQGRLHSVIRLERLLSRYLRNMTLTPDIVVSVPSSRGRLFKRGFNVSELLAKAVANTLYCPIATHWMRLQQAAPQRGQSRWQRIVNSRTKFSIKPSLNNKQLAQYSHVLLVDDVMATGATLNTLASLLKQYGVQTVGALVLARSV